MELMLDPENDQHKHHHHNYNKSGARNRHSFSPSIDDHNTSNPIASGPTIEELLSIKYNALNDAEQTDIATTIRNAILIPTNLNVSDDCLRILCNRHANESSLVLDTTAESPTGANSSHSSLSSDSEAISDQDQRCALELATVDDLVERRSIRKVSPLPKGVIISGIPILNPENSGNAVFDGISDTSTAIGPKIEPLSFNGRIPAPPPYRPDHVIIQIEPDSSAGEKCLEASTIQDNVAPDKADEDPVKPTVNIEESFEATNERSPDLFADPDESDEGDEEEEERGNELECINRGLNAELNELQMVNSETDSEQVAVTSAMDHLMSRDNHLLKRLQTSFSGVLPPPSVTNVPISLDVIVARYKEFNGQMPEGKPEARQLNGGCEMYLMKSIDSPRKAKTEDWPQLKNVICHDVYYNLSSATEQFEYLTVKYRSRFSGSDTASSFVAADISSAKKRANRTKALNINSNSPGRRLSHLARRRAIFSCANLQGAKEAAAQAQQAAVDLSRVAHRQILLPVRRATGRGRTPGKKRKTPGSSAKKRALLTLRSSQQRRETLTRETSKRALFQSPGNNQDVQEPPPKPKVTPEVAIRVDKSKRALFSSPKFGRYPTFSGSGSGAINPGSSRMELSKLRCNSMTSLTMRGSQESLFGKRKRDDYSDEDEENNGEQNHKIQRTQSPRRVSLGSDTAEKTSFGAKSFMRSQSFTAEQLHRQKSSLGLPRTSSEIHIGTGSRSQVLALNESEKKKLLWVVSQTLLKNQVDGKNPKFKDYATTMAKVVKRLYLEATHRTGSVTEQLNKLANNIAFQVIQNKTELEIYSAEKLRLQALAKKKLTGYVNSQEYEEYKASKLRRMSSSVFSDVSLSQCSVVSSMSVVSVGAGGMDENFGQATVTECSSTVLRENVDTEQRQRLSSQKSGGVCLVFNGKDQKNVSPYSGAGGDGGSKRKLLVGGALVNSSSGGNNSNIAKGLNVIKAKRQISFDA